MNRPTTGSIERFFSKKRQTETVAPETTEKVCNLEEQTGECSRGDGSDVQANRVAVEPVKKKQKMSARVYKDGFLKFGFVNCPSASKDDKPMCLICGEKLANESLKPGKLQRHLTTHHDDLADKPLSFFQRKAQERQMSAQVLSRVLSHNDKLLLASYKVAYRVAKEKVPHSAAEKLILPAALDIVSTVLDEKAAEKIKAIPVSDNTVSRRIEDIAENLENQLISRLQTAKDFAIQLDESTDISACATLLVYVRYVWESKFVEDLLCCLTLPSKTTGEQIFEQLNSYITTHGLDWSNCKGVTSDGAACVTGKNSGVIKKIKDAAAQNITWNHCFIHREALAAKGMPPEVELVMKDVVKIVNFIKGSALNRRLFESLCSEMGAQYTHLLFHTDVRWLSKGRVVSRIYELREEVHTFLLEKQSQLADFFSEEKWLLTVSYIADIFSILNELNLKLQGHDCLFRHCEQIQGFQKSVKLWQLRIKSQSFYMFPKMNKHIEEMCVSKKVVADMTHLIKAHLEGLAQNFMHYFPPGKFDDLYNKRWVKNSFEFETPESITSLNLTPLEESEMLQLTCDSTLKTFYKNEKLSKFWIGLSGDYPLLSRTSVLLLLPFTTTYLCEVGFSVLTQMKTKLRNRLKASADMRVALSSCQPQWDQIIHSKQAHPSH
ncbi:protein FAM200A-like [Hoplias malabaricus]|uniref:protein FAM200A-like n=1 Tax=Hoplias malabaricus TaxID=27720 RepID=UPI003461A20C